jgi:hypothetical protein
VIGFSIAVFGSCVQQFNDFAIIQEQKPWWLNGSRFNDMERLIRGRAGCPVE